MKNNLIGLCRENARPVSIQRLPSRYDDSLHGAPARAHNPPHHPVRVIPVPSPRMNHARVARDGPSYDRRPSGYPRAAEGARDRTPHSHRYRSPPRSPYRSPPRHPYRRPPRRPYRRPPRRPLPPRHPFPRSAQPFDPAPTAAQRDDPDAKYFDDGLKRQCRTEYDRDEPYAKYFSSTPKPPRESIPDHDARRDAFDAKLETARREAEDRARASPGATGPGSVQCPPGCHETHPRPKSDSDAKAEGCRLEGTLSQNPVPRKTTAKSEPRAGGDEAGRAPDERLRPEKRDRDVSAAEEARRSAQSPATRMPPASTRAPETNNKALSVVPKQQQAPKKKKEPATKTTVHPWLRNAIALHQTPRMSLKDKKKLAEMMMGFVSRSMPD